MIYQQSVFDKWPIDNESVQAIITSPPYYALRKYDIPDVIIGGVKDCQHNFEMSKDKILNLQAGNPEFKRTWRENATQTINKGGFCIHCSAWKGQYGLEPTPQMYIEHTLLWAKEAWRVLKNDGIMFLNVADSYAGGGKGNYGKGIATSVKASANPNGNDFDYGDYPSKCKLMIPERIAIALIDAGWTLRNSIVWYKVNAMPESVTDRFSKKYEPIFMFTKNEKYYFDLDAVKEPLKESTIQRAKYIYGTSGEKHTELRKQSGKPQGWKNHIINKNPGDVWSIQTQPSSEKHYAMWPERLVERMVKCSTKAGDTVLDPFAGSGSTLKVAEQLQRKGIGIDLGYHEISKRRTSKIQRELFV